MWVDLQEWMKTEMSFHYDCELCLIISPASIQVQLGKIVFMLGHMGPDTQYASFQVKFRRTYQCHEVMKDYILK